tara:strand:+ start:712 stop:1128 length:417 start_codon:yes stop_codon:yes gene_type:complete
MNEFIIEINLVTSITERKLGLEMGSLNVKKKTETLVLGRMVVFNLLMQGGVTPAKLSNYFCKHRTAFYHYKKLHKFYFTNLAAYPEYVTLYKEVLDEYENTSVSPRYKSKLVKLSVIDDINITIKSLQAQRELLTTKH